MSDASLTTGKQRVALVTGATGYIGSNLAKRLLAEGWDVHVVVRMNSRLDTLDSIRSSITIHQHDGSTRDMIRLVGDARPDVVFHLASLFLAQHRPEDVEALISSNLLFSTQLAEAMAAKQVKHLINTSTSWQHYENEEYNPVNLYAATKQAFESILEYYVQACGIKAITLKLFDTYGPGDPRPKLFYLLNKAATTGEPLDMSAGEQLIDLVHIDDVIEAYLIAAQRLFEEKVTQHECHVVSSGRPLALKDLVQLYAEVTKQTLRVNWGARPYRYREVMVPWNRGVAIEGWSPKMTIEYGIAGRFLELGKWKYTEWN